MRNPTILFRSALLALALAAASLAGVAKEYKTTLARDVEITYLINTTDKIARVKLVEEVGASPATKITIPEKVTYKEGSKSHKLTVVGIGEGAFLHTWFTTIDLPSTIKTIGKEAFYNTSITKIELPSKLETIGEKAFCNSDIAGTLTIPAKCRSIGKSAFSGTFITVLNVQTNATPTQLALGDGAFSNTDLKTVLLTNIGTMGEFVFGGCEKLESASLSGNLSALPAQTFSGCINLSRVGMPVVTSIGAWAFHNCKALREFDFLPGLQRIDHSAFQESGIVAARLKDGFQTLADEVFFDCPNLEIVEFPSTTVSISGAAFQNSRNIKSVSCDALTPPAMTDAAFSRYSGISIWVPFSSIAAYEHAPGWRCFDYDPLKPSGVETPEVSEAEEEVLLFDLQGNPIADPDSHRGMMIEIRGGKARKVMR